MRQSKPSLLRVVYLSRNAISKSSEAMKWEIDGILEQSQRNNAWVGVTGALIFNLGVFGQVLEGPMDAVEETFDRIQSDPRHHDVTVLDLRRTRRRRSRSGRWGLWASTARAPICSLTWATMLSKRRGVWTGSRSWRSCRASH